MKCKRCSSPLRRVSRHGFWQNKFYPIFGFYPWECPICREIILKKKQGGTKRRTKKQADVSDISIAKEVARQE